MGRPPPATQSSTLGNYITSADANLTGLDISHHKLCPAIGFDQIVGGRYKLHILCLVSLGPHRYGEIGHSLLHGTMGRAITPRILSRELKDLGLRGIINDKAYPVACLKPRASFRRSTFSSLKVKPNSNGASNFGA